MVRRRKQRRQRTRKSSISSFVNREKKEFYDFYTHPLTKEFEFWVADWHRKLVLSFLLGFLLAIFSRMYPICTQDICYKSIFELLFNPALLTKPFILTFVIPQFLVLLAFFSWALYISFSILAWVHKKKWFSESIMPLMSVLIFVYLFMLTSGALTPFVQTVGNLDCVTDNDCIRAGYVGEVCTSVYKPVYTTYLTGMKPLTNCECVKNVCVGS